MPEVVGFHGIGDACTLHTLTEHGPDSIITHSTVLDILEIVSSQYVPARGFRTVVNVMGVDVGTNLPPAVENRVLLVRGIFMISPVRLRLVV